jgi:phosphoglycerate dehydrogenase-like enzyme
MTAASAEPITILIASPLDQRQVARISRHDPARVRVVWEPELLPSARYAADHIGIAPDLNEADLERWRALLAQADVLFDFDWLEPAKLPERAPKLRWVQATSAGIGEFLARTGLDRTDIAFTTASGVHAVPLAEFVALCLLYFAKDVPRLQARQARRHWERHEEGELAGTRILVIGLGKIGREVARICSGLGVEVWAVRRSGANGQTPPGVRTVLGTSDLRSALPNVQALVLACPLTKETRHLIGATELELLPREAVVVNIGRGNLIVEPALVDALSDGRLRGAALDVFEEEPLPTDSPLWNLPNVLISPHSASTVAAENARIVDIFLANVDRFLRGARLINLFDRERGY